MWIILVLGWNLLRNFNIYFSKLSIPLILSGKLKSIHNFLARFTCLPGNHIYFSIIKMTWCITFLGVFEKSETKLRTSYHFSFLDYADLYENTIFTRLSLVQLLVTQLVLLSQRHDIMAVTLRSNWGWLFLPSVQNKIWSIVHI